MNPYAACTLLCWTAFAVCWIALRNRIRQDIHAQGRRSPVLVVLGLVAYFCLIYGPVWLAPHRAGDAARSTSTSGELGLALCVVGVWLCIGSRWVLGEYWSGGVAMKEGHRLIVAGPYGRVRHPIYLGFVVATAGSAVMAEHLSGFVALALILVGVLVKIRKEEALLTQLFPGDYPAYQRRTRMLVPFVW
jgi:protein-S-isoprenylcysteine O-methyltransferase Ste14